MEQQKSIYRFKFTKNFMNELEQFSIIHQYDKPKVFKEAYLKFLKDNEDLVIREKRYLIGSGYNGDINDKMYRSARYYFKNKDHSAEKFKDKKIRRPYIKQNSEFISVVDNHVNNIVSKNIKPSNAYDNFKNTEPYSTSYKSEVLRISEYLDNGTEIENKIKKTYKNRYFVKQKNLN
jgi:hypothetical protein